MAIYHLTMKAVARSAGRSATAAAAYRAGARIEDTRTGLVFDYRRKRGIEHAELILPGGGTVERASFWNGVERHHKRGDAVVAREIEVALPAELSVQQRQALAMSFGRELADRYGVGVDVAIHRPHRRGDVRNQHAQLDPIHCQRHRLRNAADEWRERWAEMANGALAAADRKERIDHRSYAARGISQEPSVHVGPAVIALERRGVRTRVCQRAIEQATTRLARAADLARMEALSHALNRQIIDLTTDLQAALRERAALEAKRKVEDGAALFQQYRLRLDAVLQNIECDPRKSVDDEPDDSDAPRLWRPGA
jgi:hypothetical protein